MARSRRKTNSNVTVRKADGTTEVVPQVTFDQKRCEKGRSSYGWYLQSSHWKKLREATLKRDGYRCTTCGDDCSLDVHHRTYETLGHERLTDLVTLCVWCHRNKHRKGRKGPSSAGRTPRPGIRRPDPR